METNFKQYLYFKKTLANSQLYKATPVAQTFVVRKLPIILINSLGGLSASGAVTTHDPRKIIAPSYSFGVKHKSYSNNHSPGPKFLVSSSVTRNGMEGSAKYSMYSRAKSATAFNVPGPGAYRSEAVTAGWKAAPKYSLAARTKSGKSNRSPGPAAYMLPHSGNNKPSTPAYSMRCKPATGSFMEDLAKAPGPGTYKVTDASTYKQKQPQYSMTARNELPSDGTRKPGPGAYRPEQVYVNKKYQPKYSFGMKHSEYAGHFIGAEPKE